MQAPNAGDPKSLAEYYGTLDVSDSYFNNAVSYAKWATKTTADLIGTERKDGAFPVGSSTSALTINAFYLSSENSITIFAGTLQQFFMDPDLPAYMNYGGLGTVLGHEFTHSLDNNGRLWDDKGAYTDVSTTTFHCFVKEYLLTLTIVVGRRERSRIQREDTMPSQAIRRVRGRIQHRGAGARQRDTDGIRKHRGRGRHQHSLGRVAGQATRGPSLRVRPAGTTRPLHARADVLRGRRPVLLRQDQRCREEGRSH